MEASDTQIFEEFHLMLTVILINYRSVRMVPAVRSSVYLILIMPQNMTQA